MLSLPILKPMAALTYGIYMTHLTFQTIEVSRTRVAVDYTPFDLVSWQYLRFIYTELMA